MLAALRAAIGYVALNATAAWPLRAVLALVAVGVTIHLLKLRTLRAGPA